MKRIMALVACWMVGSSLFAAITITPASRTFDKDGGGGAILTAGSGTWTASTTADWITITPTKTGNAGESVVYIVNSNFSADTRVGTITVSGNTHTITQTGYDASISPVSATFDLEGGSGELEVTTLSGVSWTARSNASWITLTSTMGVGSGTLSYKVAANSSVTTRTGTITVAGQTYSITQTGVDVTLSPVSTYLEPSANIVLLTITALNTTAWTVEPCSSWISVVSGGNGYGGGSATLAVAANPSWLERTGTVKVGSATLTIRQKGTKDLSFAITPETATAASDGVYGNVAVIATPDAPWSAESEASWITLSGGQSGAGSGNIQYVVSPNTTLSQRTGTIKITPPVVVPDVDLYRGLLFWIKDQKNIEGNEERKTTYALSKAFDGSFYNQLTGADIPALGNSGYAMSFSFKVGQLNCINRLLKLGGHSIYLTENNELRYHTLATDLVVSKINAYYTVVISVDEEHRLKMYAGEKDGELHCVRSLGAISGYLDFDTAKGMSNFRFGYCEKPSTGNLQSGQFANIRFWTRALTDRECECVDTKQNELVDNAPKGMPGGVKYDYFPAAGNGFGSDEASTVPRCLSQTRLNGWTPTFGRTRISDGALHGNAKSAFVLSKFSDLFDGSCVTNSSHAYWKNEYNYYYNPIEVTGNEDASYCFWLRINSLPEAGQKAVIFSRQMDSHPADGNNHYEGFLPGIENHYGNTINNFRLTLLLLPSGNLRIEQATCKYSNAPWDPYYSFDEDSVKSDEFKSTIDKGKWIMVTLVGKARKTMTLYVNDKEVGNVTTKMDFAWMPPIDMRYNYYGNGGSIKKHNYALSVGGWDGELDEMAFYNKAFTSKEVNDMYGMGVGNDYVYHIVTQGAASPSFDKTTVRLPANGGVASVDMTLTAGVNWTAKSNNDWLTIANGKSGTGSATITFSAGTNPSVYERKGSLTVAGKTVTVIQEGLNAAVSYDEEIVYGTDGGSGNVSVMAEANGLWTAVSDVDWITVALGASGSGNGTVMYVVAPYNNTTAARIGTLTIAGKKVYITQRGYAMSIDPYVAQIGGNSGGGSVAVSAPVGAIWEAIAKEPWITITGGQSGSGSGTLTYSVKENATGAVRTGTIIIAGEAYKITQMYRVVMSVGVEGRGSVTGAGNYDSGADVTLTATPESGYQFSHWSGAATGTDNPVTIKIDEACKVTAHFTPIAPAASATTEEKDGVVVSWGALAWADQYRVYRAEANEKPDAAAATVDKETLVWNDTTAFPGKTYYYWVEAIGSEEQAVSASVTGSRAVSLASVAISCVGELFAGDSASCSCTAAYNDGTSKGVTPSWSVEGTSATVDKSGELTAGAVEADSVVTLRASFTEDGITKTASAQVAIYPKVALDEAATGIGSVSTGGSGTWFGQKKESCGGKAALRSPRVASGVSAWVGCSVTGAGTLTFKWRKEGANAGKLSLAVNGGEVAVYGEASDSWASVTKEFYDSGDKDFKWIYAGGENVEAHGLVAEIAWTPGTAITVNFNANGGSGSMTGMTFLQGADKNLPANAFTRMGYAFAGWATSVGGEVVYADGASVEDMTSGGGGAVTLYAKWTANSYTVKFNANGGTGTMADEPMTYDAEKALTACAFTKKGYTFAGWATSAGGVVRYANGATVKNLAASGAVTLYAKWTPNSYVVDFNPGQGGAGTMPDQPMTYDEEAALYANLFARTGYTFLGWTDDPNEVEEVLFYDGVVVENLTDEDGGEYDLYAIWAANDYSVRFNANGGSGTMADQAFVYDAPQALAANAFVKTGYTFAGWARNAATGMSPPQLADAEVVSNLTVEADGVVALYAVWTANAYIVRFNANGGSGTMADLSCTYGTAQALPANAFTRTGYTFAGWATSAGGAVAYADKASVSTLAASGVATLYAKWTPITYSVKFNANGGSGAMSNLAMTYDAEKALTACAFSKTGYTFAGWATSAGGTVAYANGASVKNLASTANATVDLYAKWTANPYTVKFDANGGNGTMADESFTYDAAGQVLASNAFVRKGYMFLGWATSVDGDVVYANGAKVNNLAASGAITLYAQWAPVSVKVYGFRQRFPWNNLVDVDCEVFGESGAAYQLNIQAMDAASGNMLTVTDVRLDGGTASGNPVAVPNGRSRVIWNAATDLSDGFRSEQIKLRASLVFGDDAE